MKLATGGQMAGIDRRAIASGVAGLELMDKAGRGVFEVVIDRTREPGSMVAVVCGKGNNGGDGFVVARCLKEAGVQVEAFLLERAKAVSGDARTHLERARSAGVEIREIHSEREVDDLIPVLGRSSLIVDAILGTGLRGGARGVSNPAIEAVNRAGIPVVSVDVPSGLHADTGRTEGPCVKSTHTVTFGLPKVGHFFFPGRTLCGTLSLIDIGIPPASIDAEGVDVFLTTREDVVGWLPRREPDAHKGDFGRDLILAGSVGLTGAAVLCANGAIRSGAGLVTVGVPASLNDILEVKLTEAMTYPLPEVRRARCLSLRARGDIGRLAEKADSIALGPGLGRHRETAGLVHRLLQDVEKPLVLDADGLNALGGRSDLLKDRAGPTVITPHPGEFSRLTGMPTAEILMDPIGSARAYAGTNRVVVVLKGAPTVIADPSGKVYLNPTGNSSMATGGAGDVLTGIVTSLIGQGLTPETGARLGVYLHGAAGDLVAERAGGVGHPAGELAVAVPEVLKGIASGGMRHPYFEWI